MKNRRVMFTAPKQVEIVELDLPAPKPDEVVMRNLVTMLSPGTERAFLLGLPNAQRFPFSPGYSSVGEVVAVGAEVQAVKEGDLVVSEGRHESYSVVRANRVFPIPPGLAPERAIFLSLGAIALQGVRKARIELGESVLVIGQGPVGNLAAQLAGLTGGMPVTVVEKDPFRLELAAQSGLTNQVNSGASGTEVKDALLARSGGRGYDVVIEATGVPEAIQLSLQAAARLGRVVLLGSTRGMTSVDFYTDVHKKGLTLIGAHDSIRPREESSPGYWTPVRDSQVILTLLAEGRLTVDPLIVHRVRPDGIPALYERLASWDPTLVTAQILWADH